MSLTGGSFSALGRFRPTSHTRECPENTTKCAPEIPGLLQRYLSFGRGPLQMTMQLQESLGLVCCRLRGLGGGSCRLLKPISGTTHQIDLEIRRRGKDYSARLSHDSSAGFEVLNTFDHMQQLPHILVVSFCGYWGSH